MGLSSLDPGNFFPQHFLKPETFSRLHFTSFFTSKMWVSCQKEYCFVLYFVLFSELSSDVEAVSTPFSGVRRLSPATYRRKAEKAK